MNVSATVFIFGNAKHKKPALTGKRFLTPVLLYSIKLLLSELPLVRDSVRIQSKLCAFGVLRRRLSMLPIVLLRLCGVYDVYFCVGSRFYVSDVPFYSIILMLIN
jgi:hypothetical protein